VLLANHDFTGALAEALEIEADDPGQAEASVTIADASLELGDLATAAERYAALEASVAGAPLTARQSRLAFVQGHPSEAVRLSERAFEEARLAGQGGASLGWYAAFAGSSTLAVGEPTTAGAWFQRALELWPTGPIALAGMARAEIALGDHEAAIAHLQQAAATAPTPDVLLALGDLYRVRGEFARAEEQYATVEAMGRLAVVNQQVFNRSLVLFGATHGRDPEAALAMAEKELAIRRDAYGFDAYAWALQANGRVVEADVAIRQALAGGIQDALLDYHAGMIALARGETDRAAEFLTRAVGRPGALNPLAAREASLALDVLR
jgi:tetratricopeptide (TPR) repeat protein